MNALETQLATAEFEETWLEVRYHEGQATLAEVEEAIARVSQLRALVDRIAVEQTAEAGALEWWTVPSGAGASH
jgi:hypothetical protein